MEEYTSYLFQVVSLLIVAVIVLSLCLLGCFKSVKNSRNSAPPNEIVCVDTANQIEESNDERDASNHRPNIGHERALPEIPPSTSRAVNSVDDEEEEDDSIYDIISKNKKTQLQMDNLSNSIRPSSPSSLLPGPAQKRTKTRKKQHPYEKVRGDTDGDSTCGLPSRDPLYAGIKDVSRKEGTGGEYQISPTQASAGASDIFYVSNDIQTSTNISAYSASFPPNHSPVLPPRNYPDFTNIPDTSSHSSNNVPIDLQSHDSQHIPPPLRDNAWPPDRLSNLFTNSQEIPGDNDHHNETASVSDDHRVPNYSSVTARESLNNLRKRAQMLHDNQDEMYDTINYDAVKSASRMQRTNTVLSSDHVYSTTGSDLYAEIATGQSSSRSSMYARVSDLLPHANSNFSLSNHSQGCNNTSRTEPPSMTRSSRTASPQAGQSTAFGNLPSNLTLASDPFVVRSNNSDFPIYSVVNKSGRPKTFHDSSRDEEATLRAPNLRKSCIEGARSFQKMHSPPIDRFHPSLMSPNDDTATRDASEPRKDDSLRTRFKAEHGYAKIVFNKQYTNHKTPNSLGETSGEKCRASIYDRVNDSVYEPVPVDIESKDMKFPNQAKFKSNEKIRLPWRDKHKKSNEESRRDHDLKKTKLSGGFKNESAFVFNYAGCNGTAGGSETKFAPCGSPGQNLNPTTNCSSFPRFDRNRHNASSGSEKNSGVLKSKSRFYVTSNVLPDDGKAASKIRGGVLNEVPSTSLHLQTSERNPPVREHIYELVKDAAYIDDDDDDDDNNGVILESDV